MTAWHYYDRETPDERQARIARESHEAAALDERMERRYGMTHGLPSFEAWDQAGDLMNGDAERDAGIRRTRVQLPAKREPGRENGRGSGQKRRTA